MFSLLILLIFAFLLLYLYFPPCKRQNQPQRHLFYCRFLGQPVYWYQNVSILDFIGNNDHRGGSNNWSYKTVK